MLHQNKSFAQYLRNLYQLTFQCSLQYSIANVFHPLLWMTCPQGTRYDSIEWRCFLFSPHLHINFMKLDHYFALTRVFESQSDFKNMKHLAFKVSRFLLPGFSIRFLSSQTQIWVNRNSKHVVSISLLRPWFSCLRFQEFPLPFECLTCRFLMLYLADHSLSLEPEFIIKAWFRLIAVWCDLDLSFLCPNHYHLLHLDLLALLKWTESHSNKSICNQLQPSRDQITLKEFHYPSQVETSA